MAASDGLIQRITTYAGTPAVKEGDFVKAGQILIRGEERGKDSTAHPVRARGEVIARQWVSVTTRVPMTETVSEPTGRQTVLRAVETPFFVWQREDDPNYLTCDRNRGILPLGGAWLPVWLVRESFNEVSLHPQSRDVDEAKREGAQAVIFALNQALNNEETVDKWMKFDMIEGDTITVTATAEILRDIGRRGQ